MAITIKGGFSLHLGDCVHFKTQGKSAVGNKWLNLFNKWRHNTILSRRGKGFHIYISALPKLRFLLSQRTNVLKTFFRGAWVAQSVEHLTLDFGSGHDPRVMGLSPMLGLTVIMEPAWDSLFLSLFLSPPAHSLSLSLSLCLSKLTNKLSPSFCYIIFASLVLTEVIRNLQILKYYLS